MAYHYPNILLPWFGTASTKTQSLKARYLRPPVCDTLSRLRQKNFSHYLSRPKPVQEKIPTRFKKQGVQCQKSSCWAWGKGGRRRRALVWDKHHGAHV